MCTHVGIPHACPEVPPLQAQESGRRPHRRTGPLPRKVRLTRELREVPSLLAERFAHGSAASLGSQEAKPQAEPLTITEVCARYDRHCQEYYVKNGVATNQVRMIRLSLHVLKKLYGSILAKDFGPLALEACQAAFVQRGLSRREVNRRSRTHQGGDQVGDGEGAAPPRGVPRAPGSRRAQARALPGPGTPARRPGA